MQFKSLLFRGQLEFSLEGIRHPMEEDLVCVKSAKVRQEYADYSLERLA